VIRFVQSFRNNENPSVVSRSLDIEGALRKLNERVLHWIEDSAGQDQPSRKGDK